MKASDYTVEKFFGNENGCKKCGRDLSKAVNLIGRDILSQHVMMHAREDFQNELYSCREQIQEDLRCLLDGMDTELVDNACQIVVDRFGKLLE